MKNYIKILLLFVIVGLLLSGCSFIRKTTQDDDKISQMSEKIDELNEQLESLKDEFSDQSQENISETYATKDETNPLFKVYGLGLDFPELKNGYRLKIIRPEPQKNKTLTINIQNTGGNKIQSEPISLAEKNYQQDQSPITYIIDDMDLIIINCSELEIDNVINIDLPIRKIEIEGNVEVNISGIGLMLEKINVEGEANINFEAVDLNNFDLGIEGAANVGGDGKISQLSMDIAGASNVDFADIVTDDVILEIEGASVVDLNVNNNLSGSIKGVGQIRYHGSPTVNVQTEGAALVTQLD